MSRLYSNIISTIKNCHRHTFKHKHINNISLERKFRMDETCYENVQSIWVHHLRMIIIFFCIFFLKNNLLFASIESFPTSTKFTQTFIEYKENLHALDQFTGRTDVELEKNYRLHSFDLKISPWLKVNTPNDLTGNKRAPKVFFEMKEGYISYTGNNWDLVIGNQIINWGTGDLSNQIDIWNPQDLSNPNITNNFICDKLPATTVFFRIEPRNNFFTEFLISPFFRANKLPYKVPYDHTINFNRTDSRWLLPLPSHVLLSGVHLPVEYNITHTSKPHSIDFGTRIKIIDLHSWDFSFIFFRGTQKNPRISLSRLGNASNPNLPIIVSLHPSFHKESIYAISGEGSILKDNELGVQFNIAYFNTDNSKTNGNKNLLQSDYLKGQVNLDYSFETSLIYLIDSINIAYIFNQKLDKNLDLKQTDILDSLPKTNKWDKNLIMLLQNNYEDDLDLQMIINYSLKNSSYFFGPIITYNQNDNLSYLLSIDYFAGPKNTYYGQFYNSSRLNFSIQYQF